MYKVLYYYIIFIANTVPFSGGLDFL